MSETLHRWLARRPPCPGVLAWGIHVPGHEPVSGSGDPGAPPETLARLWVGLGEAVREAGGHGFQTLQQRWLFSQRVLYVTCRPDGACLGILADRAEDTVARPSIERVLADFRALRVSAPAR